MHRIALLGLVGCGRVGFGQLLDDAALAADAVDSCTKLAIADNFDDGVADPQWAPFVNAPVTLAEAGGQLQIMLTTATGSHYGGYESVAAFDLRDHCMFVTYAQVPAAQPSLEMLFVARTPGNDTLGFVYADGTLAPFINIGAMYMTLGTRVYDPIMHQVLRLREGGGSMTWESSSDGVVFSTWAQQATPLDVSAITISLEAGTFTSVPSPGVARFDNLNAP